MTRTKATLLAVTVSVVLAPAARAQYAGLAQVQQQMIQAQKEAEENKAKEEAKAKENPSGDSSSSSPSSGGDSSAQPSTTSGDSEKKTDTSTENKPDEEKKPDEKKPEEPKSEADKKAEAEKKEAEKKAEADKKAEEEKNEADKKAEQEKADKKLLENKEAYNPMKDAVFAMQTGRFSDCVSLLNQVLAKDGKNVQAHYLLAVAYVNMRKYAEAAAQYKKVLQDAPNSQIAKLAAEGLSKIAH